MSKKLSRRAFAKTGMSVVMACGILLSFTGCHDPSIAYSQGKLAYKDGLDASYNPYILINSRPANVLEDARAWNRGWIDAQHETEKPRQ